MDDETRGYLEKLEERIAEYECDYSVPDYKDSDMWQRCVGGYKKKNNVNLDYYDSKEY